jgi:RND family efflux transporter MFP subunit
MEVQPNLNLYTIADLSQVWAIADVYEYELPWLALGQTGAVALSYLPGQEFSGPVTYIAPFLDPKTRTAQVRLELANPDGELRPGMFGDILIQGSPIQAVVAIPSEAVIRSGRRTLVIIALGEGRFAPRPISIGLDSGDGWIEVRDGLAAGEEIVVSSQFLIDSESNLQEAVRKLLSMSPAADDPHAGHDMPPATDPHAGHDMPPATDPHAGHDMPPATDPHAEHGAPELGEE